MTDFIPGLALSRGFYHELVRPLLDEAFPGLAHSAALIGSGSEVLGFDTAMSSDHHWGPRLLLFLREADMDRAGPVHEMLRHRLPPTFRGYPTNFGAPDPTDKGTQLLQAIEAGPVNHRVEIATLRGFFEDVLKVDIDRPLDVADWLTLPQQSLLSITAGAVYHDDLGLDDVRARLAYFPPDVWRYLLAAGWTRIGQEEHLMGRAGYVGDDIGSALIGGRLVRDIMHLCFLMERRYAPYPKWYGTAFKQLACADSLLPSLSGALAATSWQAREQHLCAAYETLARLHNALGITDPVPDSTSSFFGRPFRVIWGERVAEAITARITDPAVRALLDRPVIGSIDQISDSTDLRSYAAWRPRLRALYE